jgi:hypothetical protein
MQTSSTIQTFHLLNDCISFLASVFPWCFDMPQPREKHNTPLRTKDKSLSIVRAGETELKQLAPLFDLYRQFYQQPADPKLTRRFLRNNIRKKHSTKNWDINVIWRSASIHLSSARTCPSNATRCESPTAAAASVIEVIS